MSCRCHNNYGSYKVASAEVASVDFVCVVRTQRSVGGPGWMPQVQAADSVALTVAGLAQHPLALT
jgi:hypothetical protein